MVRPEDADEQDPAGGGEAASCCIERLRVQGARGGNHVLDADIRDYFGSIDHERLMNAARKFNQIDDYARSRLRRFMVRRKGRNLRAGEAERWTHDVFYHQHGLHRLRGNVQYPEAA